MLARIWRGEVHLAFVFWVIGVLISPLFFWVTFHFGKFLPGAWAMLTVFGIWLLYGIFISLVIWRSSTKYTGRKVWSILSRIAICATWVISLGIGFGVFYFMGVDFYTTSYTIEKQLEADPAYPYIGFWKNDCSDNFGLAIEKATNDEYYVRFCGPGGCFGKTSFMRTKLINDSIYKILDNDTIGMNVSSTPRGLNPEEEAILKERMKDGLLIYKRCK
jgi:hypothetical protein